MTTRVADDAGLLQRGAGEADRRWLFESAAATFLERTVGVILSGGQRDGARGAARIAGHGGQVIVQDPATALQPSMPLATAGMAHHVVAAPHKLGEAISLALARVEREQAAGWDEPFKVA